MMMEVKTNTDIYTRASVAPSSFNEDELTFDVTFTTEAPVKRFDYETWKYYNEVLGFEPGQVRMERLNSGAPVLNNHSTYGSVSSVIGVVEKAWLEKGQGGATIRLSKRESNAEIVQDVRDGILKNVSIGYRIHKYLKEEAQESDETPTYRAIDWEPMEISLVTVPADASAQVRADKALMQRVEVQAPEETIETDVKFEEENKTYTGALSAAFLMGIK